jgi:hypothetical protein
MPAMTTATSTKPAKSLRRSDATRISQASHTVATQAFAPGLIAEARIHRGETAAFTNSWSRRTPR